MFLKLRFTQRDREHTFPEVKVKCRVKEIPLLEGVPNPIHLLKGDIEGERAKTIAKTVTGKTS